MVIVIISSSAKSYVAYKMQHFNNSTHTKVKLVNEALQLNTEITNLQILKYRREHFDMHTSRIKGCDVGSSSN